MPHDTPVKVPRSEYERKPYGPDDRPLRRFAQRLVIRDAQLVDFYLEPLRHRYDMKTGRFVGTWFDIVHHPITRRATLFGPTEELVRGQTLLLGPGAEPLGPIVPTEPYAQAKRRPDRFAAATVECARFIRDHPGCTARMIIDHLDGLFWVDWQKGRSGWNHLVGTKDNVWMLDASRTHEKVPTEVDLAGWEASPRHLWIRLPGKPMTFRITGRGRAVALTTPRPTVAEDVPYRGTPEARLYHQAKIAREKERLEMWTRYSTGPHVIDRDSYMEQIRKTRSNLRRLRSLHP